MGIVTHMMYTELSNNNNNNDEPEEKRKKKRRRRRGKTSRPCNCKLLSFPIMKIPVIPTRKTAFVSPPFCCRIRFVCNCPQLFMHVSFQNILRA